MNYRSYFRTGLLGFLISFASLVAFHYPAAAGDYRGDPGFSLRMLDDHSFFVMPVAFDAVLPSALEHRTPVLTPTKNADLFAVTLTAALGAFVPLGEARTPGDIAASRSTHA